PITTEIYPLSLHDALPIYEELMQRCWTPHRAQRPKSFQVIIKRLEEIEKSLIYDGDSELVTSVKLPVRTPLGTWMMKSSMCLKRSEEHTSELQSRENLVCR